MDLPPAPREGEYGAATQVSFVRRSCAPRCIRWPRRHPPDMLMRPQYASEDYADYLSVLRLPPDRLRASDLNEVLMPDHVDRLRFSVSPLQV